MKKYYLLSSFLHLVLVILIVLSSGGGNGDGSDEGGGTGNNQSEGKKSGDGDGKSIIAKAIEVTVVTQPKNGSSKKKQQTKKSIDIKDCKGKAWYGGIGIEYDFESGIISKVVEGYPAFKAGIKAGYQFVNSDNMQIIGEVGTNVHFVLKRPDNSYRMYNLVREKICIK